MQEMNKKELYAIWKQEEDVAHIHGWDFSHLRNRYEEENDLPWSYESIVRSYLTEEKRILDFDTGGAEFLLSLGHPYEMTSATEGYKPNVELCRERLLPLGVTFKECSDCRNIPFEDNSFDVILNRHGGMKSKEFYRLLKKDGIFITEQVGSENDRDLVQMVLPDTPTPFPDLKLEKQKTIFEKAGFRIVRAEEAFRPIEFYDVGAFVWFARVIEWEFPGFSVDSCFEQLLQMQKTIERNGKVVGTIHRFLIVAKK